MIAGWLVKLVVFLAMAGLAAFELGSPLLTKAQLDDAAHQAADSAAAAMGKGASVEEARDVAAERVARKDIPGFGFEVTGPERTVKVTVSKQARSYVLKRFGPTKHWYQVTATATAAPK